MEPGKWIRALQLERSIKPSDIERSTRSIADARANSDFYVSHSTLADIESKAIPGIHKVISLALAFKVQLNELLQPFGIDQGEIIASEIKRSPDAGPFVPALRGPFSDSSSTSIQTLALMKRRCSKSSRTMSQDRPPSRPALIRPGTVMS
jgi:hypothetical protein